MNRIKKIIGLLISKIAIIKKNRIIFMSYNGAYNDSPKYIFEEMMNNQKVECVWLVNNKNVSLLPPNTKYAIIDTLKAHYYIGSAAIIVDNNYGTKCVKLESNKLFSKIAFNIDKKIRFKKKQKTYSTWHGTPLKKMGVDQLNSKIVDFECKNMTMLFGNKYTLKIMKHLCFDRINTKLIGTPRNDILFINDRKKIDNYKKKLELPIDKKIILFAPSFRTDSNKIDNIDRSGLNQINSLDFDKLFKSLNKKFGGEWIFVCRFHYHVSNNIDWNSIEKKYKGMIINGNKYSEMSEYLLCSDILISDTSSCLFDFSVTNRPSFIYFPDYEYYSKIERGLYLDVNELPFPFSTDNEQFIKTIDCFDYDKYYKEINKMKSELEFEEDGNATKKITEYILEENNLL